ncbi:uncharacterized protein CIMG_13468 [Coccidioides immitis RS]|uniref:Uncharacterized protein n=1 Tax=Coccidioides immitis (strain RS) TaxID=246410 RepID=J3KFM2_COCIM|nr:uncharacterized protein CIMG_13468 [Coccidioides immitis RS]EAS34437.3 hypothetical protein CIMG_13468 [Coccidioides immitis RS]
MYLTTFSKEKLPEIIEEVYKTNDEDSYVFSSARVSALEFLKDWKYKMLRKMSQKHVKNVKKIDHKDNFNIGMHCCQNPDKLFAYFAKHFDPKKFFEIFFWAEPIVDYEKSKQLGQWYIKLQVKLHDDLMKKLNCKKEAIGAWWEILKF